MKTMLFVGLLFATLGLIAQDDHQAAVDKRGDHMMGFSHEKTTHHFRLYADGGAIEVTANEARDTESRDQIRMHLSHIAVMFAAGNFQAPMLIHDQVPPGVPTLQRLKAEVSYRFEEITDGARVRIVTKNKEALLAVHEFLKFQISDHRTGDILEVMKENRQVMARKERIHLLAPSLAADIARCPEKHRQGGAADKVANLAGWLDRYLGKVN